jgi:hypothetical protein
MTNTIPKIPAPNNAILGYDYVWVMMEILIISMLEVLSWSILYQLVWLPEDLAP